MKKIVAGIGIGLGVVVALLLLGWVVGGNSFFLYRYFAPRYEQTRRQVFEQSRAFNQGMVQELENMQFEYEKAEPKEQAALRSIILHRASGYNMDDPIVPASLRSFIQTLKEY